MFMFGYDLGIDLGTTNIVIGVPGKGIRLDEPAYVAYDCLLYTSPSPRD